MPKREDVFKKLAELLNEKTGGQKPCPICNQIKWAFTGKFVVLSAADSPNELTLGGHSFPTVPLVCGNCGNTMLLNVLALGVKDMNELKIDPDEPKPKS